MPVARSIASSSSMLIDFLPLTRTLTHVYDMPKRLESCRALMRRSARAPRKRRALASVIVSPLFPSIACKTVMT